MEGGDQQACVVQVVGDFSVSECTKTLFCHQTLALYGPCQFECQRKEITLQIKFVVYFVRYYRKIF